MLTATWNWLWEKHDQTKDMFRFFAKGTTAGNGGNASPRSEATPSNNGDGNRSYKPAQLIGLILGPVLFFLTIFLFKPEGLSPEGLAILASTLWIATWWMTEAIPIPATSLLPIILFPLAGGLDVKTTTASYGDGTVFLFMGGFIIALAMEKWNLHRRIALTIINLIGTNMERIILGFMVATGFLSMWISNTATAMMMVPIGLAIIVQITDALKGNPSIDTSKENFGFGKALMLGIAYSASLGGVATLIGTPPNALFAGAVEKMYGINIGFGQWMLFGVPIAWIFILFTWFYLVKVVYPSEIKDLPGGPKVLREEKEKLGAASYEEKIVFVIFVGAALAWISRTFVLQKLNPAIDDTIIAIAFAILLFVIPSRNKKGDHLMDWNTAMKLPWGILLLFGGGLAIASGFTSSGLSEWIGAQLTGLQGLNTFIVILTVATLVIFLTEITSNTATASMMYPIMAALAVAVGIHPIAIMVAAGVAASCAFMLPVATPPNAVVFGSGYLRIPDMVKAGFALNIFGIILVALAIYFLLPVAWGLDLNTVPEALK
ncbi:SLC13 family permease [Chungangia koreensis]|uniref:Sodium-dependent dicarboxylate transporter SdcS n=1 Tax=Chungangia koreensis TaxID=752657 RepID=A0ABV8X949_9LACT